MFSPPLTSADGQGTSPIPPRPLKARQRIIVAVRKRPLLRSETTDVVAAAMDTSTVVVTEPKVTVDMRKVNDVRGSFRFDCCFDEQCSNARIYATTTKPLLEVVRRGGTAVVCAFGQTGSGKTHTMLGSGDGKEHGIYALAARDIIEQLRGMRLSVSFYEIYGSKLFDLLNNKAPIQTLEDENRNVNLVGLTEHPIRDHGALLDLMLLGSTQRASGTTHVNERSSRSHAVLKLTVRTRRGQNVFAQMSFIDLAGSERAADTLDMDKRTRAEGAEINKSLLALKECIRAMHERKKHIPFRGSKLTQVLRDSFVGSGNGVTVIIANVAPGVQHCDDTVNTLKYADRIKTLRPEDSAPFAEPSPTAEDDNEAAGAEDSPPEPSPDIAAKRRSAGDALAGDVQLADEPTVCGSCGFPIFDTTTKHVCPKEYATCKYCRTEIVKQRLEAHLLTCPDAPAHCAHCAAVMTHAALYTHECPRQPVPCAHCGGNVPREDMPDHVRGCDSVKEPCLHCHDAVARKDAKTHALSCPARMVQCPRCSRMLKQSALKSHERSCIVGSPNRASPGSKQSPATARASVMSRLPPISPHHRPSPATARNPPSPGRGAKGKAPAPLSPASARLAPEPRSSTGAQPPRAGGGVERGLGFTAMEERQRRKTEKRKASRSHSHKDLPKGAPLALAAAKRTSDATAMTTTMTESHATVDARRPLSSEAGATVGAVERLVQPSPPRTANLPPPRTPSVFDGSGSGPTAGMAGPPEDPEPCPFHDVGCSVVLPAQELAAHVQGSVTEHLLLVHRHARAVEQDNVDLRAQLRALEGRLPSSPAAHATPPSSKDKGSPPKPRKKKADVASTSAASAMGSSSLRRSSEPMAPAPPPAVADRPATPSSHVPRGSPTKLPVAPKPRAKHAAVLPIQKHNPAVRRRL